jgi:methyltransferase (TIGR00027 family)
MSQDANAMLGSTARWTASARAQESQREDGLFHDPWAAALAGEEGQAWLEQRSGNVAPMIIRTRYFDDFLQRITAQNGLRQIVMLAAGLDTRAFRLPWPDGTRLFELDQPSVLAYKEQVLRAAGAEPGCERRGIAADLTAPWEEMLLQGGFDPRLPSGWLLEGFLFYLSNADSARILAEVSALAASGSWVGFDVVNSVTLTSPWTRAWVEMQAQSGAPWIGSLDDPEAFLCAQGWKAALTQPGAPDANYGRWTLPVIPVKAPNLPHNWYVTAQKE